MAPWDVAEDRALLLSVIAVAQVQPNWEDVATQLGKTKEAVRYDRSHHVHILSTYTHHSQRFAKLKKDAAEASAAATNDNGDGAAPAAPITPTPRKRKTKAKAKKVTSDDEDENEGTPLAKKSKKVIKTEDQDEDEA